MPEEANIEQDAKVKILDRICPRRTSPASINAESRPARLVNAPAETGGSCE